MVTCYDSNSAQIISETSIDVILVGDSVAMTMHGHQNTIPANIELMALHTEAVSKMVQKQFIVGDLPFLSTRKSISETMNAVEKLMRAGAHAVKLEGLTGQEDHIAQIVAAGVPVMGHVGLTPQFLHQLGGFRMQGRKQEEAQKIATASQRLEDLGCFSVVVECVPERLAQEITETIKIPTIGIGAGPHVDGQVLVWHDLLGLNPSFKPKFVKTYMNAHDEFKRALQTYDSEVKNKAFPTKDHLFRVLP